MFIQFGAPAPDHLDRRRAVFMQDVSERLKRLAAAPIDLLISCDGEEVRADHVVLDASVKRVMIIEFVLPAVRSDDDIPRQLAICPHLQSLFRELLVCGERIDLLGDLKAAHHILVRKSNLAGNHENVVSL